MPTTVLDALSIPPSRKRPSVFSEECDTFLSELPALQTGINAIAAEMNVDATALAAQVAQAALEVITLGATMWISGETYVRGNTVWTPTAPDNHYRMTEVSLLSTVDPTLDPDNWANLLGSNTILYESRTSNTIFSVLDRNKIVDLSGTFSQTFAACPSLKCGWVITVRNIGTGVITLTPDGTDTIDAGGSVKLAPGAIKYIHCNGSTALRTLDIGTAHRNYYSRTSDTVITVSDNHSVIDLSGTFSQTFASSADLQRGWSVTVKNAGTGVITLTPDGTETIDGAGTVAMYPGEIRLITTDGSNLFTVIIKSFASIVQLTSGTSWTCPPGVTKVKAWVTGGGGSSSNTGTGTYYSASGGGGGTAIAIFDVVPGTSYTYAIAAPGGTSSFTANGVIYSGSGGSGGTYDGPSGFGGSGSGTGAILIQGQGGESGVTIGITRGGSTITGYGKGADGTTTVNVVYGSNGGIILELYK